MQRLVLVDDEPDLLQCLTRALRHHCPAVEVVPARDADEAVRVIEQGVDVLVTDVRMPGPCALGMIVASRGASPHIRVLVMTAYADHPPFPSNAATAYLEKPFELGTLIATTKQLLARRVADGQSIVDVAQLCCLAGFTGWARATHPSNEHHGSVWFQRGSPRHASVGTLQGASALRELIGWGRAAIELHQGAVPTDTLRLRRGDVVAPGSCCTYDVSRPSRPPHTVL